MSNHFASIGFQIESNADLDALVEATIRNAEEIRCRAGRYLRWSPDRSVELWFQVNHEDDIVGITPAFNARSRMRVGLTAAISRADDTPFEGMLHGWADPTGADPQSGQYPFVFDLVDKACHGELAYPVTREVALAAFAHELTAYESEAAYELARDGEPRFAAESFIPSGLFVDDTAPDAAPEPHAIFTGRVIEHAELTNPLCRQPYLWARVRTLGGEIDVLADPTLVEGHVCQGGIVSGHFWLNGRIIPPEAQA